MAPSRAGPSCADDLLERFDADRLPREPTVLDPPDAAAGTTSA